MQSASIHSHICSALQYDAAANEAQLDRNEMQARPTFRFKQFSIRYKIGWLATSIHVDFNFFFEYSVFLLFFAFLRLTNFVISHVQNILKLDWVWIPLCGIKIIKTLEMEKCWKIHNFDWNLHTFCCLGEALRRRHCETISIILLNFFHNSISFNRFIIRSLGSGFRIRACLYLLCSWTRSKSSGRAQILLVCYSLCYISLNVLWEFWRLWWTTMRIFKFFGDLFLEFVCLCT